MEQMLQEPFLAPDLLHLQTHRAGVSRNMLDSWDAVLKW